MNLKNALIIFSLFFLLTGCSSEEPLKDQAGITNDDLVVAGESNTGSKDNSNLIKMGDSDKNVSEEKPEINNNNLTMNEEKNNENSKDEFNLIEKYDQVVFKTNLGDIQFKFYSEDSLKTVDNFLKLSEEGFYDGTRFHRIISDFMIQGGDPLSKDEERKEHWGTGGPGYKFEDEINSHKLVRGSLAMANSGKNTNGSQFFIVTAEATPWLDGAHTNFGEVVSGMEIVEKIESLETDSRDRPIEDVIIEKIDLIEK